MLLYRNILWEIDAEMSHPLCNQKLAKGKKIYRSNFRQREPVIKVSPGENSHLYIHSSYILIMVLQCANVIAQKYGVVHLLVASRSRSTLSLQLLKGGFFF